MMDIGKIENKVKEKRKYLKKNKPILYILLLILILYVSFFGGAFLHDSSIVSKYNLFYSLFGQNKVEIDFKPFPNVYENGTSIPFYLKNVGDKNIESFYVIYSFCGLEESKATLNKNKLYRGDELNFELNVPIRLNTSCQYYTNKVWGDVYEDFEKNCYIDVPDDITENYCSFCKVKFSIFMDGKEQKEELWYPYLGDNLNSGEYLRNLLVTYPLTINWVQNYSSECKVLVPNTSKEGLIKKSPIGLSFFDTYVMCSRGEDISWCKENYYDKN